MTLSIRVILGCLPLLFFIEANSQVVKEDYLGNYRCVGIGYFDYKNGSDTLDCLIQINPSINIETKLIISNHFTTNKYHIGSRYTFNDLGDLIGEVGGEKGKYFKTNDSLSIRIVERLTNYPPVLTQTFDFTCKKDSNLIITPVYDTDGDKVYDDEDICANTPSGEVVNAAGCSLSQIDDDQDGVENSQDLCPNTPQEETVNSNGCAESQLDEDQDGVIDALDHCPGTKELEVDANGCGVNAVNNKLSTANLLYPNPATNHVTLAKTSNKEQIELFSTTGVKLKVFSVQKGEDVEIDTSVLEKGLYLLKVGESVHRFVKE
jgi:hypothetical protein